MGVSINGYRVIHKRDVDEIFVNNYNPEWIHSWNANMDLQICLDYYAIITYISDYYSKDDSGTMKHIKEAMKQAGNESLKTKLSIVVHQFLTHRQIGESEAYFRLLPHLNMKHSNIEAVFIQTGFRNNRSKFLKKLTEEEAKYCEDLINVSGRKGQYTEKPSLMDKYVRRDYNEHSDVFDVSYLQFGKRYTPTNTGPKQKKDFVPQDFYKHIPSSDNKEDETDELRGFSEEDFIITHDFKAKEHLKFLPKFIKINNPLPGEPNFMKLRKPVVARRHKFSQVKKPHEFYLSELQLYRPFKNEEDLSPECLEKCTALYEEISEHNKLKKITNVKNILMKHLEAVEEGKEKAEEILASNVGAVLDPENEQDNADCEDEEMHEHPDFIVKSPADLDIPDSSTKGEKSYRKIELYDEKFLEDITLKLDREQRKVLDKGVDFAGNIVKNKNGARCQVEAPLFIVQGGAGSGKSTVIDAMSQQMEKMFRRPGDNPNHPYILKVAFTGTAAANIKGQTMHSAFSFSFGNEFLSLGDKSRDEKRSILENLMVVIIDEYSMIKADMLYLLDLRLKEIKQRTDLPFGGVAVFLLGDILQLRPVRAVYIFEEPRSETYHISYLADSLWEKFDVVMLTENHRQGEDKEYADLLNRMRVGDIKENDVKMLQGRVRPLNHPDISKNTLVVTCNNEAVNKINEERLADIDEKEYVLEAIAKTHTRKCIKPQTDASGAIRNTPLQKILKLKVRARVMLTFNIDTCDGLTNGTFGEVIGFEFDEFNCMTKVIVEFDNEESGKEKRKNFLEIQQKFKGRLATPIERIEFQYSLSKKSTASNATAIQFPLRLSFAATAHKVQGFTVKKPNQLVIDLRTVREAAQAYVMLSRVQALSQLIILEDVCAHKIYSSPLALNELERLTNSAAKNEENRRGILSCNIRSLSKHFKDIVSCPKIRFAEAVCCQETWLDPNQVNGFNINGFYQHYNSVGPGKGIVTYYKNDYKFVKDITREMYQLTKITSEKQDIINVYRSARAPASQFIPDLSSLFSFTRKTLLVGDFNICFKSEQNNPVLKALASFGFKQKVKKSTHLEGRLIDHVYIFCPMNSQEKEVEVVQQVPYFTDHDIIFVLDDISE